LVLLAVLGLTACAPSGLPVALGAVTAPTAAATVTAMPVVASTAPVTVDTTAASAAVQAQEQLLAGIYQRVDPAVVNITFSSGSGSGFVYDDQGHIVTNNHVVANAGKMWVTFSDGTMLPATIVGTDSGSDLAVIKVERPASELHAVTLGDSENLQVGQLAVTIGNPFGLQGTMTTGIVSAVGRVMPEETSNFAIVDMVQTDSPINPGNSGGPLLDSSGRVIGVNTLILSETGVSSGVGFAVPVATVKKVVPALISTGHYEHPWLGLTGGSITPAVAESLGLSVQQGVLVESVVSGGPAALAGIRGATQRVVSNRQATLTGGDIILAVDGLEVKSFDDLVGYLGRKTEVGQKITLTVLRDGQRQSVDVTLTARPTSA